MLQQFLNRLEILFRSFFDHTALQRAPQIEHRPIVERILTHENRFLCQFARDNIDWPAHITVHDVPTAVGS
jgi:hypothetical protein